MEYTEMVAKGMDMLWFRDNLLQVTFPSIGCQQPVKCVMCGYGACEKNCSSEEAINILSCAIDFFTSVHPEFSFKDRDPKEYKNMQGMILLLGSQGSILDQKEVPHLRQIFSYLQGISKGIKISRIILETHYKTVDLEYLHDLRKLIYTEDDITPEIYIEMGYESSNSCIRKLVLHKDIDTNGFRDTVQHLKFSGYGVIGNALLGVPTLSPKEQVTDCLNTIDYLNLIGVDEITVFPMNIWEGTRLWDEYVNGIYARPSYYQLLELLLMISDLHPPYLGNLYFSWYGDRQASDRTRVSMQLPIPPDPGKETLDFWNTAIRNFQYLPSVAQRQLYLQTLVDVVKGKHPRIINYFKYSDQMAKMVKDAVNHCKSDAVLLAPVLKFSEMDVNRRIASPPISGLQFEQECAHQLAENLQQLKEDDKHE